MPLSAGPSVPRAAAALSPALAAAAVLAGAASLAFPGPLFGVLPVDTLSAVFLVAFGFLATATPGPGGSVRLLAAVLCVAVPDTRGLVLGFELLCVLSVSATRTGLAGAVPFLATAALLGGPFASVRLVPPEGAAVVAILLLSLLGVGQRVPAAVPFVELGGLYVLARMLDLCGAGVPGWWGLLLLVGGTWLAAASAWHALFADTLGATGTRLFRAGLGAALAALGTVAAARAVDLTELAGLATSGFLLLVLAQVAGFTVLAAAARATVRGAGTERLVFLGGLAGSMPRTACGLAVSAVSLGFLPPFAGFAGVLPVAQAALGLPRTGLPGVAVAVAAAGAGLAAGCAAVGVLRLLATSCLGRPRTPRSSAAEDPAGPGALVLPACAVLLALAGFGAWLIVPPLFGTPGLSGAAPLLVLLLAVLAAPVLLLTARRRTVEPWNDGRGRPPPWLPYGDPAEQWSAASLSAPFRVPPLPPFPGARLRTFLRRSPASGWQAALFAVLLACFLLVARP